jgi:large subunit ribosomal protein L25
MADLQLAAQPRTISGRKVKQLRNQGLIPAVIYGKRVKPETLQIDERSLERVLHSGGTTRLIEVSTNGGRPLNALIREVQRHPVSHRLTHVDFYAVDMSEKQHISVPVEGVGRASGLSAGVIVLQVMDHITVEALPADIPAKIEVDITPLTLERPITVADLPTIAGVTYQAEAEENVFTLQTTREEVEEETETVAEPEMVGGKGKRDDEDEE